MTFHSSTVSLSLSLYIYIYICVCVCVCVYLILYTNFAATFFKIGFQIYIMPKQTNKQSNKQKQSWLTFVSDFCMQMTAIPKEQE